MNLQNAEAGTFEGFVCDFVGMSQRVDPFEKDTWHLVYLSVIGGCCF